jgi:hypothetical protein
VEAEKIDMEDESLRLQLEVTRVQDNAFYRWFGRQVRYKKKIVRW